jgi:hypothetical protein
MTATTKKSPKAKATRKASKQSRKPVNVQAYLQTQAYAAMTGPELVAFAKSRGSWWTTRAGQIERAGVKGFRARVRAALAKAEK